MFSTEIMNIANNHEQVDVHKYTGYIPSRQRSSLQRSSL